MRKSALLAMPLLMASCAYRPFTITLSTGQYVAAQPTGTAGEQYVSLPGMEYNRELFANQLPKQLGIDFSREQTGYLDLYKGIINDSTGLHHVQIQVTSYDGQDLDTHPETIGSITITTNYEKRLPKLVETIDTLLATKN